MNGFALDFSGNSQGFQGNHLIPFAPDVVGALKAVTARLKELDPYGNDHWINNNLQKFGVSSAYLSSTSSIDISPFDIHTSFETINPACLAQLSDPIARTYLSKTFEAASTADETGSEDDSRPLSGPDDKITSNKCVAYLDDTKCQSLAAEWDTITRNFSHITNSRVEHKQLNQFDTLVLADSGENESNDKSVEDEKESCPSGQSPAFCSFTVGREFPLESIKDEEECSGSEIEDFNSVDDGDYKDDEEDNGSDDRSRHDFEQCISRPPTPPSSPPAPVGVSCQEDECNYRYSHGGKSARKSATKTTFARTPLPSSPITKTNNKRESPSKKRARTCDDDENALPSPKVARKYKATSLTGTRVRRQAWSNLEQNVLHQLLVERRAQEARWPTLEKKFDNALWFLMSEQLMARFGIDRAPMACKNHWGRKGRHMSGFDERSALKRSSKLATSVQVPKTEILRRCREWRECDRVLESVPRGC
ncbi:hypothetical protein ACMFMF_003793 [Clarireedia jacksonii]